jgi:protein gp37
MSANTSIQWTDRTWNPVRGCSRVSPGCDHCYAMGQAHRFAGPGKPYDGLTTIRRGKVDWTGVARFIPEEVDKPLSWRKPQRVFVNSMSDLFHSSLSNEEIAAVFAVMAVAPRHTFQVLTKRPERAREWFGWAAQEPAKKLRDGYSAAGRIGPWLRLPPVLGDTDWPLPNVWLGVSVENQETADERIPLLLKTPAAVRFISAEPLLGPVDLSVGLHMGRCASISPAPDRFRCGLPADHEGHPHTALHPSGAPWFGTAPLDWVIVGGESGPGARECRQSWLERVVADCREASVPVFVKQMGSAACDDVTWRGSQPDFHFSDRKGGDPAEWPRSLQVREFPRA